MRILTLALATFLTAGPAMTQAVDPAAISVLQAADDDWEQAQALGEKADPVTRDVLTWMRLRAGAGTFVEYQSFLTKRPDWPGLDRLRQAGELLIPTGTDPEQVAAYFADVPPQTGQGAVRYVRALQDLERTDAANSALRDAWINLRLSDTGQKAMIDAFGADLAPFHAARTDALLWRARTTDARRMLPLLEADQRALAAARIGYIRKSADLPKLGPMPSKSCSKGQQARPHWANHSAGLDGGGYWHGGKCAKGGQTKPINSLQGIT